MQEGTSRQLNIDFGAVDIGELSSEVISNMGSFDVDEFDQYLPPHSHIGVTGAAQGGYASGYGIGGSSVGHAANVGAHAWMSKQQQQHSLTTLGGGGEQGQQGQQRTTQIKTEQLSPSHYSEHSHGSPPHSDYGSYSSQACVTSATSAAAASFSSSQCDYTDLQSSNYYNPYSGYPSSLYQYPYFHSSRRPYSSPILNSLSMAPTHSPNASSWDQPVYTTLSRP